MFRYTIQPLITSDIPRLAEIQREAFREDPLFQATVQDLSEEENLSWICRQLESDSTPPEYRREIKVARDIETNEIAGWAKWWIPVTENKDHATPALAAEESQSVPTPSAVKQPIWSDFFAGLEAAEKDIMGDRKHWGLIILVVDPAWQRRGVGKALVEDGIQRAQKDSLPIFLSGSPKGVPLYKSLGFEVKDLRELTDAKIPATFFEKTPV